jgi:tetratricopeptide (TPR) repeat protein
VNREEYLHWMDDALVRCKEKSIILHLRGIGGIGKSTLLNHWSRNIDTTVRLDCQQYTEFYSRLDILAKGAVRVGVDLKRFDILWHVRKRFVEGVEPATEKGRDWAKEVLVAIPFIGSLASIGSAIKSVGESVAPKLRQRYGDVGQWLQDRLGAQYMERLLEILWKEPQHAEFLYLDALLEDINNRKEVDTPLLFLFDHSENVDCDDRRWIYAGKKIAEMELWYVFVSSLKNCVGVIASRRAPPPLTDKTLTIEEKELVELDRSSSRDLLLQRGVIDENFQEKIASISAGNPFVINTICDMQEAEEISLVDIENLRAETLDDVRLKTWRRLFSHTKDLVALVDRAGLLPSFHKELMTIVSPDMKTDQWERLIRLSFIKPRSNGSFVLHDLARDLVRAELGDRMSSVASEVSQLLKEASERERNPTLLGFAVSVQALDSEDHAIAEMKSIVRNYIRQALYQDALSFVESLTFQTYRGDVELLGHRGMVCSELKRYPEAEFSLRAAISAIEELADSESLVNRASLGSFRTYLGDVLYETLRYPESEKILLNAAEILRVVAETGSEDDLRELMLCLRGLAYFYYRATRASEGVPYGLEALEMARKLDNPFELARSLNVAAIVLGNAGQYDEQIELYREAVNVQRKIIANSNATPFDKAHLAALLSNLNLGLHDQEEIERNYAEAYELRKEVSDILPTGIPFWKLLYGWWCLKTYRFDEAEVLVQEALEYYCDQGKDDALGWTLWIDFSRLVLSLIYLIDDKLDLARSTLDLASPVEMVSLVIPSDYFKIVSQLVYSFSGLYYDMIHQPAKAIEEYRKAIELLDTWVINSADEVVFAAQCLLHYGILCGVVGELDDARTAMNRAEKIVTNFGTSWSAKAYSAFSDGNIALVHYTESKFDDAEKKCRDAIAKIKVFAGGMPAMLLPILGKMLNNYSLALYNNENLDDALNAIQKALDIKRELAQRGFNIFKESLATSLNNSGILLFKKGDAVASKQKLEESLDILRELTSKAPKKYSLKLASSLQNHTIVAHFEGDEKISEDYFNEALALRKEFINSAPELVLPLLSLKFEDIVKNEKWSVITEPLYLIF